ncbi:MAG: hypothetical protein QME25_02530, partial [Bacteroidota bacterium]|nr:hypothetical protein [Bacteroidota bacterium]
MKKDMKFGRKNKYLIIYLSLILFCTIGCKKSGPVEPYKPPCPPIEIVPPSPYDSPIWHPSGDFIGFNHTPLRKIHYPYGEHCQGEYEFASDSTGFWLINPDGTNKRRIFPYRLHSPAWSPDGEWIAFMIPIGSEAHIFKMRFTGTTFDTTTVTQLTFEGRNFFPAWSPDGLWIAYDRSFADASGPGGIWIMKSDGESRRFITSGRMPVWHPQGSILWAVPKIDLLNTFFCIFKKMNESTENNMNMQSKKNPPRGLFDEFDQLDKLSKLNDPLERLIKRIDFEVFRDDLNTIYQNNDRKSNAGAKPYDYVMML